MSGGERSDSQTGGIRMSGITSQGELLCRTIRAVRAENPPIIDGKLDDACWAAAETVTGFVEMTTDRLASRQSFGYVCYDDAMLYIGMKCMMPRGMRPRGRARPHDSYLVADEIVEIMIDPGLSRSDYFHFMINAYGSTYDAVNWRGGALRDPAWNADWAAGAHIGEDYWSAEAAIPFHALGLSPGVGPVWGINLCREAKVPHDQYSSIAVNGAVHDAKGFARLEGLAVDFRDFFFRIDPPVVRLEPGTAPPRGRLGVRVRNMTGERRAVRIERVYVGAEGEDAADVDEMTLAPDEEVVPAGEMLDLEPLFPGRTDAFIIRSAAATKKVVVSDAGDGRVLASSFVRRPYLCEAMRVEAEDPWRRDMPAEKTRAISLTVTTNLDEKHLRNGELGVELRGRETGEVVAGERFSSPSGKMEMSFPTEAIPWGAYDVRAVFRDGDGRELVASRTHATVLPGGRHRVKVLNNLVSELMNAEERGMLGEREIAFMNPRDGWVFFSISGSGGIRLDSGGEAVAAVAEGERTAEAMRRLPAGRHTLRVEGRLEQVIVRAVPELFYATYPDGPGDIGYAESVFDGPRPSNSIPYWSEGAGLESHDWEFLSGEVLPNCNVIIVDPFKPLDERRLREWAESGREWIAATGVPGYFVETGGIEGKTGEFASVERLYEYWTSSPGFRSSHSRGVIADEFSAMSDEQYIAYADALRRIASEPGYEGKMFYAWTGQMFGSDGNRVLLEVVLAAGWPFSFYKYISEPPGEEQAREWIRANLVQTARSCEAERPGLVRRAIATLGLMTWPPLNENVNPRANFKTLMEMEFETLANDPAFFGLYGAMWYYSAHHEEEYLRWGARLCRHYAIEGKCGRLSSDPYLLEHIRNPDFEDGTEGWEISEAEAGGVSAGRMPGYGVLQGRYLNGSLGDTFLVTRRSAKGPNSFSQEIRGLTPGRLYSVKMITADHGKISSGISSREHEAVAIEIEDAEMTEDPRMNYRFTYPNRYPGGGASPGGSAERGNAWMTLHRRVFRAVGATARLTISDWQAPDEPGGPIGQEVRYNFIEVEPYLE